MIEMKTTKDTKSLLAKLLASENIIVEHGNFQTASFDVKSRVLRLPIWKEMSGSLYDLLVLHEVGHALYTPEEGLHDAKNFKEGFKSYLNVVEDARIERKIKNKFPGGRRAFISGYKDLMERDFFGINRIDVNKLNLIDRINLHYKAGDHLNISFSEEESVFIDRIDKAETFKTVMEICHDLYEYSKENESETDMSDHLMSNMMGDDMEEDFEDDLDGSMEGNDPFEMNSEDGFDGNKNGADGSESADVSDGGDENGDFDSSSSESSDANENGEKEIEINTNGSGGEVGGDDGDFDPESITDKNFRENETDLVSDNAKPYVYVDIPNNIPMNEYVVDYKEIHTLYRNFYINGAGRFTESNLRSGYELATEKMKEFRNKNKKVVEYLAKEFEMKKAARDHKRSATANSGIIDSEKLYTYKYNEHVFKKLTVVPDGKNHGLVMFIDWSGSMSGNMKGTIEQMMTLVMFCKRVNIPFEVYAFSDTYFRRNPDGKRSYEWHSGKIWDQYLKPKNGEQRHSDLAIQRFSLLNLFSSRMGARELHEAYIHMAATSQHYTNRYLYGYREDVPIPNAMSLGGTPLDSTLIMSFSVMRDFQKRNNVDVINSIFLTDGDSSNNTRYWDNTIDTSVNENYPMQSLDLYNHNVLLRDPVSKKQIKISGKVRRHAMTSTLVKFSREVFNINIVNFYLVPKLKKWDIMHLMDDMRKEAGKTGSTTISDVDEELRKFRKEKFFVAPGACGFNEQYMILGGKNLEVSEQKLEVGSDATPAQLARAFKSFSKGKLEKRKLLSRFINMVAV